MARKSTTPDTTTPELGPDTTIPDTTPELGDIILYGVTPVEVAPAIVTGIDATHLALTVFRAGYSPWQVSILIASRSPTNKVSGGQWLPKMEAK